jgi:hypothetical protein
VECPVQRYCVQGDSERVYSCKGFIQGAVKNVNMYVEFIQGDSTKCLLFFLDFHNNFAFQSVVGVYTG